FYVDAFSSTGTPSQVSQVVRYREVSDNPAGTVLTVEFTLGGLQMIGFNGGPEFSFTPAISFFVACETEAEVDALYEKLAEGGEVLMPLDTYPFSERYAWINDKYGVSWQLLKGSMENKVTPAFLFVGEQ